MRKDKSRLSLFSHVHLRKPSFPFGQTQSGLKFRTILIGAKQSRYIYELYTRIQLTTTDSRRRNMVPSRNDKMERIFLAVLIFRTLGQPCEVRYTQTFIILFRKILFQLDSSSLVISGIFRMESAPELQN